MGIFSKIKDVVSDGWDWISDKASGIGNAASMYFGGPPIFGDGGMGTDEEGTSWPFDSQGGQGIWGMIPSVGDIMGGATSAASLLKDYSPLLAGGLSYMGQNSANEANERLFRTKLDWDAWQNSLNRDYGERLSNTSWQRGVNDMKAAGINPMLAFSKGGASSPQSGGGGSASANIQSALGPAVASAAQVASMMATIDQTRALTEQTKAQTEKTLVDADVSRSQVPLNRATTAMHQSAESLNDANVLRIEQEIERIKADVRLIGERTGLTRVEIERATVEVINAKLQGRQIVANTRSANANAQLAELAEPRARNLANVQGSDWMRNISPYLDDAGKVSNSAGDIADIIGKLTRRGGGIHINNNLKLPKGAAGSTGGW